MRRLGIIVVAGLALVALIVPVAQAGHGSGHAAKTATFVGRGNSGEQGGRLQVSARVKHAQKGATFTATAVVHFASGDITVALARHGKSFNASAKVPVAPDEALGPVAIDVTVTLNGADTTVQSTGRVVAADEDEDEDEPEDD